MRDVGSSNPLCSASSLVFAQLSEDPRKFPRSRTFFAEGLFCENNPRDYGCSFSARR